MCCNQNLIRKQFSGVKTDGLLQQGSGSLPFNFDSSTPVSFVGSHTPLTTPTYDAGNNTVSCTDTVTGDGDYPYVLTLWVSGEKVVYPSVTHVGNGDPEIHNHPN